MDDLIAELDRAQRRVDGHVVELRRVFATDPADLWDAYTDPDRVRRWFLPLSGDLRLGGRFQLEGNAGGAIEVCDPPHRLEVTWECAPLPPARLIVELQAAGNDTELILRHAVPDDDHWAQYGPGAVGVGWDMTFPGLALHLTGTDPSRDLQDPRLPPMMRASAAAWGAAHEASGADPETAQRMAAATSAAYAPPG